MRSTRKAYQQGLEQDKTGYECVPSFAPWRTMLTLTCRCGRLVHCVIAMAGHHSRLVHCVITMAGYHGRLVHCVITMAGHRGRLVHCVITMAGHHGRLVHRDHNGWPPWQACALCDHSARLPGQVLHSDMRTATASRLKVTFPLGLQHQCDALKHAAHAHPIQQLAQAQPRNVDISFICHSVHHALHHAQSLTDCTASLADSRLFALHRAHCRSARAYHRQQASSGGRGEGPDSRASWGGLGERWRG